MPHTLGYAGKVPSCFLEQQLFNTISEKTPDYIKNNTLLDLNNPNEIKFILKKEHLDKYDEVLNPEGLGLLEWFENYEKEAKVSTAGIRGPQNILWPHDTRFPINTIGIMLATLGKALVAKEKYPNKELRKIAANEVRYNSDKFLNIIYRVQANLGVKTHIPVNKETIPIWLASFLAFKLDLLGGEYITSSHGISVKNATKDLNNQGSQYLPEESMEFVGKIREIFNEVQKKGSYTITLASEDNSNIDQELMKKLNNGIDLYVEYLKNGVATDENLSLINNIQNKIVIENVGGCAYNTLSKVLSQFNIQNSFEWFNKTETPFFHGIGKVCKDNNCFYDWSVDAAVVVKNPDGSVCMPVIESLNYDEKLKYFPTGTIVLITDPDHDRLSIAQVENINNTSKLQKEGIDYIKLVDEKILTVYTPNQGFLMLMDFWAKQLKQKGLWNNHPRFMIKTTPSAMAWDEWANKNDIKVVNVPVGFKEIANIMKKVEKQIRENPQKDVIVEDIYGNKINLGVQPRLIFGGEESGGMIIGPEELIESVSKRVAVAMREKSATEAIFVASALAGYLEKQNMLLSDYLNKVFEENHIIGKFDVREDIAYYNESNPDINELKKAKKAGEALRTKNDVFYLTLAMAKQEGKISLENIKDTLCDISNDLDFSNLNDIKYVGDGTFLEFSDKFIEIRPSGTDAKTKAYGAGSNKEELLKYAKILGNYSGELSEKYKEFIDLDYYNNIKPHSLEVYLKWASKGEDKTPFEIPDYSKTLA